MCRVRVYCSNCGWTGTDDEQKSVWEELARRRDARLDERLGPGEIVPTGECPQCGAFCYYESLWT